MTFTLSTFVKGRRYQSRRGMMMNYSRCYRLGHLEGRLTMYRDKIEKKIEGQKCNLEERQAVLLT